MPSMEGDLFWHDPDPDRGVGDDADPITNH